MVGGGTYSASDQLPEPRQQHPATQATGSSCAPPLLAATAAVLAVFGALEWRDLAAHAAATASQQAGSVAHVLAIGGDPDDVRAAIARTPASGRNSRTALAPGASPPARSLWSAAERGPHCHQRSPHCHRPAVRTAATRSALPLQPQPPQPQPRGRRPCRVGVAGVGAVASAGCFSSLNERDRVVCSRVRGFSPGRVIIPRRVAALRPAKSGALLRGQSVARAVTPLRER
jgi:hypothetical protein